MVSDLCNGAAAVRFTRGGTPLVYDWTEYLDFTGGLVSRRTLACGGALADD